MIIILILMPIIVVIGYQLFCIGDGILYRKYGFVKEVEKYVEGIKKQQKEKKLTLR